MPGPGTRNSIIELLLGEEVEVYKLVTCLEPHLQLLLINIPRQRKYLIFVLLTSKVELLFLVRYFEFDKNFTYLISL